MITDAGKELIAKYLLGQVPSYASFISFGCGAVAEVDGSGNTLPPDPDKEVMDFELIRVPITSRSYLVDKMQDASGNDVDRNVISLVGQMPFDEGMRVNEIAIWSDSTNALTQSNSRMICAFTEKENWMWLDGTQRKAIEYYNNPLSGAEAGDDQDTGDLINSPVILPEVFSCSNTNQSLLVGREGQGTRFLNHTIMMNSDTTIFCDGKGVDLPDYSSFDQLRFAFAFYSKLQDFSANPEALIKIRFMKDPSFAETSATWNIGSFNGTTYDPETWGIYNIAKVDLGDESIQYGTNFSWKEVKWIQIEVSGLSGEFYFAPDALRFDNIATQNPLYKMTGYTRLENDTFVEHQAGTNSYAQFRFELGAN